MQNARGNNVLQKAQLKTNQIDRVGSSSGSNYSYLVSNLFNIYYKRWTQKAIKHIVLTANNTNSALCIEQQNRIEVNFN